MKTRLLIIIGIIVVSIGISAVFLIGDSYNMGLNEKYQFKFGETTIHNEKDQQFDRVFFSYSHDYGVTFSEPRDVSMSEETWTGEPKMILMDKDVILVWREEIFPMHTISFAKSNDFGKTFEKKYLWFGSRPDIVHYDNVLYLTWVDLETRQVLYTTSNDRGETFAEPIIVFAPKGEFSPYAHKPTSKFTIDDGAVKINWSMQDEDYEYVMGKDPSEFVYEEDTGFDSYVYYEEFGLGSPLIYIETSKPVLDEANCNRYAYWMTEHQKEKIDLYEDYPRYPPWGNQIFPLVDFCTANGDLVKFVVGDKIQWSFYKINSENYPGPESFRSSEPSTKIELSFGQPYQDGLVPVTISEVTIFAEDLDEITVWNFGLIGHSGDDRRVAWDLIPKEDRIGYQIINDDSQDIIDNSDTPQHLIIPADQHIYKMNCGMFDNIEGESAHPTKVQIKPGNYAVIAKNSQIGIYPDSKGEYSFEFASIFPHYVRFAEDSGVEFSSDTKQCSSTWQIDSESGEEHGDGFYTSMNFRFE